MNNNINVEISDLQSAVSTIYTEIDNIEKALANAETAGNNAINALGGTSTPAGDATNSKMVAINKEEFDKTKTSIHNFWESLTNTSKTYQAAEDDFVNKINSYDPSNNG